MYKSVFYLSQMSMVPVHRQREKGNLGWWPVREIRARNLEICARDSQRLLRLRYVRLVMSLFCDVIVLLAQILQLHLSS